MAVSTPDYYAALGVPHDASPDDIRRAYRTLARRHHPDVNRDAGAEDRFKQISEAYEVLRDPEKRESYDRLGAGWRAGDATPPGPDSRQGFDSGGFGFDFGDVDAGDIFEQLFGSRGARGPAAADGPGGFSIPGSDAEATIDLSLEESATGGRRHLVLGDGRELDVEIPPGIVEGQRIRLAGQGGAGTGGGAAGDLYLRVHLLPHPSFRAEGRDLYVDLPVSPWEAALGAEVPVPTLGGGARVRVPAGSSSGRRLRLRGQGLPGRDGARAGDLYALLTIAVPRQLSRRERKLFEQLADASNFDPRASA